MRGRTQRTRNVKHRRCDLVPNIKHCQFQVRLLAPLILFAHRPSHIYNVYSSFLVRHGNTVEDYFKLSNISNKKSADRQFSRIYRVGRSYHEFHKISLLPIADRQTRLKRKRRRAKVTKITGRGQLGLAEGKLSPASSLKYCCLFFIYVRYRAFLQELTQYDARFFDPWDLGTVPYHQV